MTAELTADILIRPVPQAIAQAKTLLTQGIELAKLQEFERAIAHFTQSIRLALALLKPDAERITHIRALSTEETTTVEVTVTQSFYHRGCMLSRLESYDRAIADFTHLIHQPPTSATIPATWLISKLTEIYIHRGNAHRRLGEYSQSLLDLNKAVSRSNGSAQSYGCRGLLRLDMGEFMQAAEDFSAAIRQHPTFAQGYLWRGFAHLRNNSLQIAIADLNHAIAAIPTCAEAYSYRGIAHLHQHNLTQAQADFSQAIRLNPNFAEAYNNRGNLQQLLGNSHSATADYDKAITLTRTTAAPLAELYLNRAATLTNDLAQAKADYDTTTSSLPLNSAAFYRHRAKVNAKAGHISDAIADYTAALAIAPTAYALYQRGRLYVRVGERENALADFDRALMRSPDYAAVYCDRSHLRFQNHDLTGTLADTNKAIELSPTSDALKETFITCCLTHFSLENKQQALQNFEQLITLIQNQSLYAS